MISVLTSYRESVRVNVMFTSRCPGDDIQPLDVAKSLAKLGGWVNGLSLSAAPLDGKPTPGCCTHTASLGAMSGCEGGQ